ncbi:MAG TPA: HNH endonuclease [Actinobacteria bacterium]|nr:HNH endonuclease [Actinomycetota bacterium]
MIKTLILNASAEPLNLIPARRAVILVLKEKAEIIEGHIEKRFRSETKEMPYPLVVRLVKYVQIPRRWRSIVTNPILFARDEYTCQYCDRHKSVLLRKERLTREHVKPVSRGGTDTWDNVTTACSSCNHKKGNRLPYEVRMYPKTTPFEPRYVAIVLLGQLANGVQRRYIEPFMRSSLSIN